MPNRHRFAEMTNPRPPKPATAAVLSRYVTVADVAEALGCSDDHVYSLISDGLLPTIDIRRKGAQRPKLRVPIAAVERYAASRLRTVTR
jgi:excisionase family DNA binding protein